MRSASRLQPPTVDTCFTLETQPVCEQFRKRRKTKTEQSIKGKQPISNKTSNQTI